MSIKEFSQKSLNALENKYYVYGLIDPRDGEIFYIGKGNGQRVFNHEQENLKNPNSKKLKLEKIADIKSAGMEVGKVLFNWGLSEDEAFAAEAALINAFTYIDKKASLTNEVAGHHAERAYSVDEFEKIHGAEELSTDCINGKNIMVIKINKLYRYGMTEKEIYDAVRGIWRVAEAQAKKVDYVLGVYNSLIVGVYKPTGWFRCKDYPNKVPNRTPKIVINKSNENRMFFEDVDYTNGRKDPNVECYLGKTIVGLSVGSAQNPVTYLKY